MNREVIIIGAGGHGRVISDIITRQNDIVYGYLDDADINFNVKIIGKIKDCVKYTDKYFVIAIGDNSIRKKIAEDYPQLKYYTAIHPDSVIGSDVIIGEGTCVMANAVINKSVVVGKHCIVNTHATVEHDSVISDFVHISPSSTLCGAVSVGECTQIGAGATIKNNINITSNCIIGLGAAVIHDIEEPGVYVGIPACKESVEFQIY